LVTAIGIDSFGSNLSVHRYGRERTVFKLGADVGGGGVEEPGYPPALHPRHGVEKNEIEAGDRMKEGAESVEKRYRAKPSPPAWPAPQALAK